jgi:excisionase family DNA binding protein
MTTSFPTSSIPLRASARRGRRPAPASGVGTRLLLTVEEAADCLGVGRTYMFPMISRGKVPSVRVGKLRRVKPEDLEDYVASL